MAEDPYKVLGVPRDAPDEEIRRAYRKLAKELHPDLNPSNRGSAEERFKKVSAAYDIVGDPVKRKQYDRGEIDANGEQRRGYQRAHAGGPARSADALAAPGRARSTASATSSPICSARRAFPLGRDRQPLSARAATTCAIRSRSIFWRPRRVPRSA